MMSGFNRDETDAKTRRGKTRGLGMACICEEVKQVSKISAKNML
jgi:hypothetical protein